MLLYRPLDSTQAQAGALSAIAARGIGAIKPFKNVGDIVRRDPYAVICDIENRGGVSARKLDLNAPSGGREFDRVICEVKNDTLDPGCVSSKYHIRIAFA